MTGASRLGRSVAAALLGVALLAPSAAATSAPSVVFGAPTASPVYGTSITFKVPYTASSDITRLELRLQFPQQLGPDIIDVAVPSSSQTLAYTLDLGGGATLVPNTRITATWIAYPSTGNPVSSQPGTVLYADTSHAWRTIIGTHIRVFWYAGDEAFARSELEIGEKAITDASALFGVSDSGLIDFFIYGDQASFVSALGPGTRETQIGLARADIRTLFGLITPDTLNDPVVAATVPHELVHIVFDEAVHNPYRFPPTWMNEGLAVYLSEGYSADRRRLVEQAVRDRNLLPLVALGGQFPSDPTKGFLAYCEGVSAIDYIVRTDGRDAMVKLIKAYADGVTDDVAFKQAIGVDLATFQAGWLKELGAEAPTRYGPASPPPGPLPSGWGGNGATLPSGAPSAGDGSQPGSGTGAADRVAVLLAIGAVVVIVIGGLVLARRRSAAS